MTYVHLGKLGTFLVAQTVKGLTATWETQSRFLGREDPLEKEMATHASTLAWKIPWTEEPGRIWSMRSQSRTQLSDFTSLTHLCLIVHIKVIWYHVVFVFLWFISLSMKISSCIHVAANDIISFFYGYIVFHCMYTTCSLSTYLLMDI